MKRTGQDISAQKLVMLVDDSSIDNFINQNTIVNYKFSEKVISFTIAAEALEYLSDLDEACIHPEKVPSFIFLDLRMPLISGFAFLERFDKFSAFIRSRCRIVILTNSSDTYTHDEHKTNKHVFMFLQKPLLKTDLEKLNVALKKKLKTIVK